MSSSSMESGSMSDSSMESGSTSDSSMESVVTYEPVSRYDLEYKDHRNDAWYSVFLVLDVAAETLTAKYSLSPGVNKVKFSAGDFSTKARLKELLGRFRPHSRHLRDYECPSLSVGTSVCAALGSDHNHLLYYDAVVEKVKRRPHSYVGGEEKCLCSFVLSWQHGPGHGTSTPTNIARICDLESSTRINRRLRAFKKLVKKKIASSSSNSADEFNEASNSNKKSKSTLQDVEGSTKLTYLTCENEGSMDSRYGQWTGSDDEEMEPKSCNVDGHFYILIDNLEKGLAPSSIKNFISEETAILPEAFVFPRKLSDQFARGAIMVDCQEKAQTIHEFLVNPNHLVVSSRGRPWIITEKEPARTFETDNWNLIPASWEMIPKRASRELKVVISGTESYNRAEQLRNLFVDYLHRESQAYEELVLAEKKILQSNKLGSP